MINTSSIGSSLNTSISRDKEITPLEKHRRILFTKFVGIMVNTGMRPKEFLTLKWKDVSAYKTHDTKLQKKISVITIRAENSKTGRARNIVAPVRRRFEVIKNSLKKWGSIHHLMIMFCLMFRRKIRDHIQDKLSSPV